ncbi:hypothetical protein JKP75_10655 [Blastococcus sp. TML/M2B]|uniref:hypothetical protein n=1 Tax=Blastococcus sp. TML/M2B TaxID=2798727 RepID=UPI0019097923|nr:hypothetical protein [Blastococcus sp. TML/M2B]
MTSRVSSSRAASCTVRCSASQRVVSTAPRCPGAVAAPAPVRLSATDSIANASLLRASTRCSPPGIFSVGAVAGSQNSSASGCRVCSAPTVERTEVR